MKRQLFLPVALSVFVAGSLCWAAVGRTQPGTTPAPIAPPQPQSTSVPIPDYVTYRHFFHHLVMLRQKSNEMATQGQTVNLPLLTYQKARLSAEQQTTVEIIAQDCEQAVAAVDAQALPIIEAYRASLPKGASRPSALPPLPAQLATLQTQRNNAILAARDRLRTELGETEFAKLQNFINTDFRPNITATVPN